MPGQGCTNPEQVSRDPNICGSSVWNFLQAPRILRLLLDIWRISVYLPGHKLKLCKSVTFLVVSYRWSNEEIRVKTFNLEQAIKVRLGSTRKAHSFFNLGARWGGWWTPRPGRLTSLYRMLVGPWPVWKDEENLTLTGIRSAVRPTHSGSLCRLSYSGPGSSKEYPKIWHALRALPDTFGGCDVQVLRESFVLQLESSWTFLLYDKTFRSRDSASWQISL
jgi:hypothetical protein